MSNKKSRYRSGSNILSSFSIADLVLAEIIQEADLGLLQHPR